MKDVLCMVRGMARSSLPTRTALFTLGLLACSSKNHSPPPNERTIGPVIHDATPLRIAFGDCDTTETRFVSGPRPVPLNAVGYPSMPPPPAKKASAAGAAKNGGAFQRLTGSGDISDLDKTPIYDDGFPNEHQPFEEQSPNEYYPIDIRNPLRSLAEPMAACLAS